MNKSIKPTKDRCPYREATLLQQALAPDKMQVAFLLGAGCPMSIRVDSKPLIPDITGLTNQVLELLDSKVEIKKVVEHLSIEDPNIEQILTHIRSLNEVVGKGNISGLTKAVLDNLDKEICEKTTEIVATSLPSSKTPYHNLARWIGGIRRAYPVEIFTPNYDLLMEQSLENQCIPYFDGFSGSHNAFFDLSSMEQDKLPPRWARLWKLHGSINWWKTESGVIRRSKRETDDDRQMIYPSHLKYNESRRMPYLAMLDRLRGFLSRGQAVLVICGYSFSDQHLNEVILQGLNSNPTAVCFGLLFGSLSNFPEAILRAEKQRNLSLLAEDGAILGTTQYSWKIGGKIEEALHNVAVQSVNNNGEESSKATKFILGNFDEFGSFLAHQFSQDSNYKENLPNA